MPIRNTQDYDNLWKSFIVNTLWKSMDVEKVTHITETENDDWIDTLKNKQKEYEKKNNRAWLR